MSFLFINKILRLNNLKTRIARDPKISVFIICVEAIIYLLLYNLYDCTFKTILTISKINYNRKFSWVITSARLYQKYIVKIVLFITYDPWQIYLLLMIYGRYIFYLWSMTDISFTSSKGLTGFWMHLWFCFILGTKHDIDINFGPETKEFWRQKIQQCGNGNKIWYHLRLLWGRGTRLHKKLSFGK